MTRNARRFQQEEPIRGFGDQVEGNRRLTAVKLLLKPELASTRKAAVLEAANAAGRKPAELPVLKFKSRDQVLRYLAFRHITGIEPWNPLQKAR